FCPDTGAQSNVLPIHLFRVLYPELINAEGMPRDGAPQRSDVILTAYGGSEITQFGKILIPCQHKRGKFNCIFYITDAVGPAILGIKACRALELVSLHCALETKSVSSKDNKSATNRSRNYIKPSVPITSRPRIKDKEHLIEMYPECFDGSVGCFEDYTYHITLDPKVQPVVHAPRRVPLELVDKLNFELNEMEKNGVIEKVTKPTDWVNSIVIREKPNGRLRLCLDPKDLNEAIMRDHYPTPTLEEITPKLAGARVFSKIDARNGYWNVKFLRMPFGLRMSQDVFQFKIDETYRNCPGATGIADDITVHGRDESNHDLHLHDAMERTRMAGIKLNQEKCIIKTSECSFFDASTLSPAESRYANIEHPEEESRHGTSSTSTNAPTLATIRLPVQERRKLHIHIRLVEQKDIIRKCDCVSEESATMMISTPTEENGKKLTLYSSWLLHWKHCSLRRHRRAPERMNEKIPQSR
ncbi:Hypothetical predicted protein, partial [Paramuricea clavata]